MGQKVSPVGLRVGINKGWESSWYASNKDFAKFLNNDHKIRKYLFKKFENAGISQIIIERNSSTFFALSETRDKSLSIKKLSKEIPLFSNSVRKSSKEREKAFKIFIKISE